MAIESMGVPVEKLADGREFISSQACAADPYVAAFVSRFPKYWQPSFLRDGFVSPSPRFARLKKIRRLVAEVPEGESHDRTFIGWHYSRRRYFRVTMILPFRRCVAFYVRFRWYPKPRRLFAHITSYHDG